MKGKSTRMTDLIERLTLLLDNPSLTRGERVQLQCEVAKRLEEVGDYEGAQSQLADLWGGTGTRPAVEGLDRRTAAEVLLRVGTLTGWLGAARQTNGLQERAKDLLSESLADFESLGDETKAAEVKSELAYCYWREGAYEEAGIFLDEARALLEKAGGDAESMRELAATVLLRKAIVEQKLNRLQEARELLLEAVRLAEEGDNSVLKGKVHVELATTLKNMGAAQGRPELTDQALVEYAAAGFHFEQAGHLRYWARVENNLGMLFLDLGRFPESHEHIGRAQSLFKRLNDYGSAAQVAETRARALLAEGRPREAEESVRAAVKMLEAGGEQALLAEALTTHGISLARLGREREARLALERAAEAGEVVGDREGAGGAVLSLIEELGSGMPWQELCRLYRKADELLSRSKNALHTERLRAAARNIFKLVAAEEGRTPRQREGARGFVHASPETAALLSYAEKAASADSHLFIYGEEGTGKRLLAGLVHSWSRRRGGPAVYVDCRALAASPLSVRLTAGRSFWSTSTAQTRRRKSGCYGWSNSGNEARRASPLTSASSRPPAETCRGTSSRGSSAPNSSSGYAR
jgi:tetratricopeptide (TPR) repeat protein